MKSFSTQSRFSACRRALLLPAALFCCGLLGNGCDTGKANSVTVRVADTVVLAQPERLGVNLGPEAYYGDQQYVENPLLHGGFAPGRQSILVRMADGAANAFADADFNANDKDRRLARELTGGEYYIATGARKGEQGQIVAHDLGLARFTTSKTGPAFTADDYAWVRGLESPRGEPEPEDPNVEKGLGIGDFRLVGDEGVKVEPIHPADGGRDQAVSIILPPESSDKSGGVKHYIRATPDTGYRVRVRARSAASGARIAVNFVHLGIASGADRNVKFDAPLGDTLKAEWRELVFDAHTPPNTAIGTTFSALEVIGVAANKGSVPISIEITEIRLEDLHLQSDTAFSRQVTAALKEARVGTLRFYNVQDIAVPVAEMTARDTTEAGWSYLALASGYRLGQVTATIDDCLKLAKETGARPWITVGNANTPEDWYALISYLAAPAALDADSQRRAGHGHEAPWIADFDRIYLEIGNEWWNPIFYPFHVSQPEKYGAICKSIIERIHQHPNFDPERIKIIDGGWAINAHNWNGVTDANSAGHDYVSVAPYLLNELDTFAKPQDKYGALFASVDGYLAEGGASTREALKANGKNTRLAVYELNTHLTGGKATEEAASEICSSAAAGVAVLDQAMSLMANLGAGPINYFVLLQRDFNGRQGLWGNLVRENDGLLRPRPVWQGLRLANNFLLDGDLMQTSVEGGGSWKQPQNGSVPALGSVPNIHAYTCIGRDPTTGKRRANVLIINRSITAPVRASIALPFMPGTTAHLAGFNGNTPAANNEDGEQVILHESNVNWPAADAAVLLPPCSATVLQFNEA